MHGSEALLALMVNFTETASTGAKVSSFIRALTGGRSVRPATVTIAAAFFRKTSNSASFVVSRALACAMSCSAVVSSFLRSGRSPWFTPAKTACME